MEVDDIEADLLRQFNCLNTSDKDVLVKEMQGLLGRNSNITENAARFYLDMADWWVIFFKGTDPFWGHDFLFMDRF